MFIHHRGRRKSKKIGADRATALSVARAIRERLAHGDLDLDPPSRQTLGGYADQWLTVARGNLKTSTVTFYETNLARYIRPAFGDRLLSSFSREDCRQLIANCRAKGLRVATVRGIVRTVSTVLSEAVEDGLLAANPALRMGRYLRPALLATHLLEGRPAVRWVGASEGGMVSTLNGKGQDLVKLGATTGGNGAVRTLNGKGQGLVELGVRTDGPGAVFTFDPRSIEAAGVYTTRP